MPTFRIHRMKDVPRENFRFAPHVSGLASVKPKDYEAAAEIEAESEYAAWVSLRTSGQELHVGDLLELLSLDPDVPSSLRICKYVGFEEARWILPEMQQMYIPPATVAMPTVPA